MNNRTYNGWTNYQTWNIKLWLDNDESSYRMQQQWYQESKDYLNEDEAVSYIERCLDDYLDEMNPISGDASMFTDLLGHAIANADLREIAQSIFDDESEG